MKTLYIDVFFFINFTVDLLSSFFAVKLAHIVPQVWRLITVSVLGAMCAIIDLFLPEAPFIHTLCAICFLALMGFVITKRASLLRRLRFILVFFLTEIILGGLVYFVYGILDRYFSELLENFEGGAENRGALVFSLIILFSIGVFKLLIMLLSASTNDRSVRIIIKIGSKSCETEALLDSGNLVTDPMNMCPVLLVKPSLAATFLPKNVIELKELDSLDPTYRKRIRLIPVTRGGETHVLTGVRADSVTYIDTKESREVDMTVAIDKEGGDFGGFEALAPRLP